MIDAITGFTNRPLRLIAKCGILVFVVMVLRWLIIVYKVYVLGQIPSELSIVLNTVLVVFSIIVLLLAFIGDYVWRILDETRQRPEFEIEEVIELNKEE
jgi:dolichol-phosphate mannosyltransferase